MDPAAARLLRTYIVLCAMATSASSLIWGVNTLFLLDTGLTVLWQTTAPFAAWAVASALLGLGFTFFSGATEAWLVDGLTATGYAGTLESAFAKGQVATGVAMLGGTVAGGVLAQVTNLGVPYAVRAVLLLATFVVAWRAMHDVGFAPKQRTSVLAEMRGIVRSSLDHGLGNPPVRWLMLAAPFSFGVSVYGFYAVQPYLLELYGDSDSYAIAGLSAALVAGAQIAGAALTPVVVRLFRRRTSVLLRATVATIVVLALVGLVPRFGVVLALVAVWGLLFFAVAPVRQAFLNGLIPSEQRATVLSSDSLLASAGGVVIQPGLGKAADVWGYPSSYIASAAVQLLALPCILLARREHAPSDPIGHPDEPRPFAATSPECEVLSVDS